MSIYISGSIAFDRIMTFNGNFQDHVLMDKLHMLNISFMVNSMLERRGGCGGNIAYSLALLGEKPILISNVGRDFTAYGEFLTKAGVNLEGVQQDSEQFTALCYITTDLAGNQITGFYPGAMSLASHYAFSHLQADDLAIVSPGNMDDMQAFPEIYKQHGVKYIFDPGQQLPIFTAEMLLKATSGSYAYVCNDYELAMTCKLLNLQESDMLELTEWLVTTLGAKGARVRGRDGTDEIIPAVPCEHVLDPTGAGDAHRSGLLFGLSKGLAMVDAAKLGAVAASYAIACQGTQEHSFTQAQFKERYEASYGAFPLVF